MSDSNDFNSDAGLSASVTGEIMVAMIIIVFMLFIAAFILYLRAKGYSGTIGLARSQSHHPVFAPNQPSILKQPLDPSILNSLHFTLFRSEDFKEGGLECAVCLSELRDGEKARLLPKCKHGFHFECIDMWFQSNATCPLCRNTVGADNNITPFEEDPIESLEVVSESQNSSTSFDEGNSSSGGSFSEKRQKGMLVVEIPTQAMEGFSSTSNTPLTSSRMPAEDIKSPALETLRSMRRILSRGSLNDNFSASFCSPRGGDIEQGTARATVIQEEFRICQLSLVK